MFGPCTGGLQSMPSTSHHPLSRELLQAIAEAIRQGVYDALRAARRWLLKERPSVINSRRLRRTAGFPGPKEPKDWEPAIQILVDLDWLVRTPDRAGSNPGRQRGDYGVNPLVYELADAMTANSAGSANSHEQQPFRHY